MQWERQTSLTQPGFGFVWGNFVKMETTLEQQKRLKDATKHVK